MDGESMELDIKRIKDQQHELGILVRDLRDIYMGLYHPIGDIFLDGRKLKYDGIVNVVEEILSYTDCADDMKDFYRELYMSTILYLYTMSIRASDMILLSVWKIAATFTVDTTRRYYENTPLGIMINDIWSGREKARPRFTTDGQSSKDLLKKHAESLEEIYNKIKGRFSTEEITREALEIYTAKHGWSCLSDTSLYDSAVSNLLSSRMDAQHAMHKGSDNL